MKRFERFLAELHPYCLSYIASILTIAQGVLSFFLHGSDSALFEWMGWICLWSSSIFGIFPIIAFRNKGDVKADKSYIHTTKLVDSGIYAFVRHPQNGTAWLLINLGIMIITRHWTSFIIGIISIALVYLDTIKADHRCVEKFGDAYNSYMKEVPSVNFLLGIIRYLNQKTSKKK